MLLDYAAACAWSLTMCFECLNNPPTPVTEFVEAVRSRKWRSVWLSDDSAAFQGWNAMYQELCGLGFNDLYSQKVLTAMQIRSRLRYLEQLAQGICMGHTFAEMEKWLDANVSLMPGLHEFMSVLRPEQGLVIVSDNFDRFVQHILAHHNLDVPFIANHLNDDGSINTIYEESDFAKEAMCRALLNEGIEVNGISGTLKTLNLSVVEFGYHLEVPVVCLEVEEPSQKQEQFGIPFIRTSNWKEVIPFMSDTG